MCCAGPFDRSGRPSPTPKDRERERRRRHADRTGKKEAKEVASVGRHRNDPPCVARRTFGGLEFEAADDPVCVALEIPA